MELRRRLLTMLKGGSEMELIKTYVVPESWENDTKGNPVAIFSTVLSDITDMTLHEQYILLFKNNNANDSVYRCNLLAISSNSTKSQVNGYCIRSDWSQARSYGASTSSWASQGTIIEVYKLALPT